MDERWIFLTGATGLLGGELLRRLLAGDSRPIACLVRAGDAAGAARRGAETLQELLGRAPSREEADRIRWVAGDIERPNLGLPPQQHVDLAARVGEIFHCAATTRFDLSLEDAHRINVAGLETVLRFAEAAHQRAPLRRLHHVSTAYATGIRFGEVRAEELPDDDPRRFRNTYERTKARAERVLRSQRRVPYTVYRPSIIVGDSRDGRTKTWTTVYFPMRLVAKGSLRYFPRGGRQLLDCVSVDFVADAIVSLAGRDDTRGGVYHITAGPDALTVEEGLRETLAGAARSSRQSGNTRTRPIGPLGWWFLDRAYGVALRGPARRSLSMLRTYVPYTRVSAVYDNRRELELLAKDGVVPAAVREFFPRIVDYALRTDFGRATSGAE